MNIQEAIVKLMLREINVEDIERLKSYFQMASNCSTNKNDKITFESIKKLIVESNNLD